MVSLPLPAFKGFGESGPDSKRGGYDVVAASMGGLLHVTGDPAGPPTKVKANDIHDVNVPHKGGCCHDGSRHCTVCSRCHPRRSPPKEGHWEGSVDPVQPIGHPGDRIQVAGDHDAGELHDPPGEQLAQLQRGIFKMGKCTHVHRPLPGEQSSHTLLNSCQTFPTSDGYLTIGCGNNNQFAELCLRMGEPDLASEEKYASNESRVENRAELVGKLSQALSRKTNREWCEAFNGVSFPYGPVNKMSEVFEEPQVEKSFDREFL